MPQTLADMSYWRTRLNTRSPLHHNRSCSLCKHLHNYLHILCNHHHTLHNSKDTLSHHWHQFHISCSLQQDRHTGSTIQLHSQNLHKLLRVSGSTGRTILHFACICREESHNNTIWSKFVRECRHWWRPPFCSCISSSHSCLCRIHCKPSRSYCLNTQYRKRKMQAR